MALILKRASASRNLPFYARQAQEIFGLDPSHRLLARAQNRAQRLQIPVHLLEGSVERVPLADRSMDTIVMTWTGCSILQISAAANDRAPAPAWLASGADQRDWPIF
jgi:ubiquinone/menaquinone biosynthesis C-methylase UbiE